MAYKQQFNKKYGFPLATPHSKKEISKLSKIPIKTLDKVYYRGVGARKTNPQSVRNLKGVKGGAGTKMSAQAWGMARIYSYVMKGKTYKTADSDLHK